MVRRAIIIVLVLCSAAFSYEGLDHFTYFGTTAESYTVAWGPGQGAEKYEIRLYHHEQKAYVDQGTTAALEYTIQLPRSGHYTVQVRSLAQGKDPSAWAESTDSTNALVDGKPRSWWLYGHVAPPGLLGMPF